MLFFCLQEYQDIVQVVAHPPVYVLSEKCVHFCLKFQRQHAGAFVSRMGNTFHSYLHMCVLKAVLGASESITLKWLYPDVRPNQFDVGVCVIPILGEFRGFFQIPGKKRRAWTGSRGSLQTLCMKMHDQVQQKKIEKHHKPV
jgi:hypothetical protein